jgi:NAD(P)-dependent dehydrogenase (short-subunit alcohol dehydrogenase family)
MSRLLEGKAMLVVGGAAGMGRGISRVAARRGGRVVVADIDAAAARETVAEIKGAGGEAFFVRCDSSNPDDAAAAVAATVEVYGRLDCAVNNAAVEGPKVNLEDLTIPEWDRVLAVNLTGVWQCMREQIGVMRRSGGGTIVNTSSVAGLNGFPGRPAYNAAKHGVVSLTKSAAIEFGRAGIRVNCVCPGFMRTPMSDRINGARLEAVASRGSLLGRVAEIDEMGEAVVWLASDASSYVQGAVLPVDGGLAARGYYAEDPDWGDVLFPRETGSSVVPTPSTPRR